MLRAYLALAAICIIWGTTYTAIKFAIEDFPPFLLVFLRQTSAGIIMLALAWSAGRFYTQNTDGSPILTHQYVLRQMLTGVFTITGGNGIITWGMQYVPSGLASIIGSLTPVLVVFINLAWRGSEKTNRLVIGGVVLGFVGLGLIFSEGWKDFQNPDYAWGILACFVSCLTWSLGTVMSKHWNSTRVSPLVNAGIQVTAGGLGGGILSCIFDPNWETGGTVQGWISLGYLSLIGSALAFTLYMFALKHLSAAVSSLYTYINPVVAILLGWLMLGEELSFLRVIGMLITILGVWVVNYGYRK